MDKIFEYEWTDIILKIGFFFYILTMFFLLRNRWIIQRELSQGNSVKNVYYSLSKVSRGLESFLIPTAYAFLASFTLSNKSFLISLVVTVLHTIIIIIVFVSYEIFLRKEKDQKDNIKSLKDS
ncbi:hypothetical protein P5641_00430 (plasmid) [Bacillus subtilis]|nr:hypothetical protein P5641_00430 [Bacillus subtilis]